MTATVLLIGSYLVGAIPFGYLVGRWRGVDLLRLGSGNIGATNVGRVLGRRWGIIVFFLDFAKGAVPVLAAQAVPDAGAALPVGAGVAAFLGHLFPVYLRFRGGKGVATASGVVAVLLPLPFLAAFLCWLTLFASSRIMSLASLLAVAVLCILRLLLTPDPWGRDDIVVSVFCLAAAAMVVARHHANIRRLLHGSENRFPDTPTMDLLNKTLHVLAVALWFGSMAFFTLTGAVLFPTFDALAARSEQDRPAWLRPIPPAYDKPWPGEGFPNPLRREQGARIAGAVVAPLFPWYFGIQAGCGLVALVTALAWLRRGRRVERLRVGLLALALVCVAVGWGLERVVEGLRGPRDALPDSAADIVPAREARQKFTTRHNYSLAVNFVTLLLVTVATALVAQLPPVPQDRPEERKPHALPASDPKA
jgi:acyl-phosphate glycerol 3-phosphate acyltransferase